MHTVFVNDHPLRFINTYNKEELELARNHPLISEHDQDIAEVIIELEGKNAPQEIFYMSENADSSWNTFISYCTLIEAAGGLVQNKNDELLFIYRRGKWDLPKGKMEYDETPENAAIREVEEECGIGNLSIVAKMYDTFHTYPLKKKRMLKKTHWFSMQATWDKELVPQLEEDILEARWMSRKDIESELMRNTYTSIGELVENFFKKKF